MLRELKIWISRVKLSLVDADISPPTTVVIISVHQNLDKIISIGSARLACISEKLSLFQGNCNFPFSDFEFQVKAMEKFKIYNFAHNLKPNKFNFHSNVVAALEGTGFENVIKATEVSRHYYPFLQALLRRYNRRVKCFEFGVNNSIRLYITLGDVLRITGLPIDGRAVIVDESSIDLKRLCSKYLGSEQLLHHGDINLPKSQSSFGNFQPGGTVKELKYHVRAYILYIIGSVLTPSPSSSVPALYLQLLRKVKRIGQYAWGAAMLAHLYYHLDTMEESKYCVSGNFHLLSMFIFERIPWIVSQLLHPRGPIILPEEVNDRPREFPLMVEWHSKMAMALKNSRSGLKESTFTDFFDQLSEDDVELNPYARLEEDFLPPPYNHQIALERCLTSIICVEKRVLYDPGVLVTWRPRNSGPFGDRKKELKKYHSKRIRKRTGHRRNWLKKNEMNIQAWKDSRNYLYDAGKSSTVRLHFDLKYRELKIWISRVKLSLVDADISPPTTVVIISVHQNLDKIISIGSARLGCISEKLSLFQAKNVSTLFLNLFPFISVHQNLDKIISIGSARLACISEKLSLFQVTYFFLLIPEVKAMEKFKIYDFAHNLKPNKFNFHSNVVAALEGTGFENVIKATEVSRHCYPFLQALLRRYNRRVKCFEFGVNNSIRLFITLGDVLRITGLPIDGRAVIVDESSIDLKRMCSKYLGSEQLLHHGDINLPKLQTPSPSSSVPALYLQLLRKVKRIGQYAWGVAMLVHLYYHLDTMEESKYCVLGLLFIFEPTINWT
ncbi:hypothetical protein GQ457_03G010280 [Hibiscus cannabinus]